MASMMKLPSHPNVVKYLGLSTTSTPTHLKLFVLEEFVFGVALSHNLSENLGIDLESLRRSVMTWNTVANLIWILSRHVSGILEALHVMHVRHNVVHRDLRDSSVFLDNRGLVRVADFSIDKRVRDLVIGSKDKTLESVGKFPVAIGRGWVIQMS